MIAHYNDTEMETVQKFFPSSLWAVAYSVIRSEQIEHCDTYRPEQSKGKGARLYWRKDLEKVHDIINRALSERQTSIPDNTLDFQMIAKEFDIEPHVASAIFGYVGLDPCGKYYRDGSKRACNVYNRDQVRFVFENLGQIKDCMPS